MGWTDFLYTKDKGILGTGLGGKGGVLGTGILGIGGDSGPNQTQIAVEATQQSTANAQALYEQALANAANAEYIHAPVPVTSQGVNVTPIEASSQQFRSTPYTATAFDATSGMRSYEAVLADAANATAAMKQANVTQMRETTPASIGQVNTAVMAPRLYEAEQTGGVDVERVAMDPLANQLRGEQIAAAKEIATAPSAAMSQFRAGQSQIVNDALAAAAAARGSDRAGARRDAILGIASGGAQQNLAAAAIAAQEEQAKRTAAATSLAGIRSQDVTAAQTQAQLAAQQANLQAQIDQAIATGNTEAANAFKQQQANLELQAQQTSVQAGLSQQQTQAGIEEANLAARLKTAETNAGASNVSAQQYAAAINAAAQQAAQNQTNVSVQNAAAQTGAAKDNATAINQAYQQFAQNTTDVNKTNAAAQTAASEANANRQAQIATTNLQGQLTAGTANAQNQLTAQTTNAQNQLQTEQLKQQTMNSGLTTGIGATNVQAENARTITDATKNQSAEDTQKQAGVLGAAGAIVSKLSDERVKTDIAPVGRGGDDLPWAQFAGDKDTAKRAADRMSSVAIDDWAAHLQPITYRYKPGVEDGGSEPHLGLSANAVERSGPLGKLMVSRDENGIRKLDYGAATLMLSKAAFDKASAAYAAAMRKGAR